MRWSGPVLWSCAVTILSLSAHAQAIPLDPLRRADDAGGRLAWRLTANYSPHGEQGIRFDVLGEVFEYTRFSSESRLSLACEWRPHGQWKVGGEITQTSFMLSERIAYTSAELEQRESSTERSLLAFLEQRILPSSQLDPRIRLEFGFPGTVSASASASRVIDPAVLSGTIGWMHTQWHASKWAFIDLGMAFVANSRVSFVVSGSLSVPVDAPAVPIGSLGTRVRYTWGSGSEGMSLGLTLLVRGRSPRMRIGLSLFGEGL